MNPHSELPGPPGYPFPTDSTATPIDSQEQQIGKAHQIAATTDEKIGPAEKVRARRNPT